MNTELIDRIRNRLASYQGTITHAQLADAVRREIGGVISDADLLALMRLLTREFLGTGMLEKLLLAPGTTDVLVTDGGAVWLDNGNGLQKAEVQLPDEKSVRQLAQRLALSAGQRLDDAQPFVDGWLAIPQVSGSVRLHAVLAPIAAGGTCISLRVLHPASHDLAALREFGTFDQNMEDLLTKIISARLNFLITGGTGSGKTTLLSALLQKVSADERIICVEEAEELMPQHPHVVRLIARSANIEGAGAIGIRELIRQALRMRPDRLILGEARGAEVVELLTTMNTGHEGCAGTVHANSPEEAPARLEALAALGGLSRDALHSQLTAAVHIVLHLRRTSRGRRLTGIGLLDRVDGLSRVVPVWEENAGWAIGKTRLVRLLRDKEVSWH